LHSVRFVAAVAELYALGIMMAVLKTVGKATFTGGICGIPIGIFGGGIIAFLIWPNSNLGPLVGFIYGLPVGVCIGLVVGFVLGLSRVRAARRLKTDA
jgi:hypothetical protein